MKRLLGVAQIDPVLGDVPANVALHVEYARRAHASGATLVVFPELSLTGYSVKDLTWDHAFRVGNPPEALRPLLEVSKTIPVIAGAVEEDETFRIYNSALLFQDGKITTLHRKLYPPTYGMFEELRYFSPGSELRAHRTTFGSLGVLICEDLWHLPLPYVLAQKGATVIIALAASPTRLAGTADVPSIQAINGEHHRTYARLLSTHIAFCNRVGYEDGVNFWGGSSVTGPDGATITSAPVFAEHLLIAPLDDEEVRRARRFSRHFLDDDPEFVRKSLARDDFR